MKKLIQGEKIGIENHHPGVALVWNSNQDIHLHKINAVRSGGSDVSVEVIIPLNSNRKISIKPSKTNISTRMNAQLRTNMIKEIREAFESPKNAKRCDEFLRNLIDEMNLINGFSSKKSSDNVERIFDKIIDFFDLSESAKGRMMQVADKYFRSYSDSEREYYIFAKPNVTEIGELTSKEKKRFAKEFFGE